MKETSAAGAIWNFLGSKTLNLFLLISGIAYSVMLSVWGTMSANDVMIRLGYSLPMKLWLIFFIVNNLLCLIKQFSLSLKTCALDATEPKVSSLQKKRNYAFAHTNLPAGAIVPKLVTRLRARGYLTRQSPDGLALRAARWRFAPLGTLIFHCAFFLIILGLVISPLTRTEAEVLVATGDTFTTEQRDRLVQIDPANSIDRLPDFGFKVKDIKARFWADKLLFTDMRAVIRPVGSKRDHNVLLNLAWKPGIATYVRLIGIGYAPLYKVINENGEVAESAYVNLVTFPPSAEDSFDLDSVPYRIYVKVYPDSRIIKGKIINKTNNLRRIGYLVTVKMKQRAVFRKFLRPNESLDFGRLHLSFQSIVYWGQFKIVHNPGLLVIWAGFIMGLIGMVWRLVFYRKDFTCAVTPGQKTQTVHMHARSDYFPYQIRQDLEELAREIEAWSYIAPPAKGEKIVAL